MPTRSERERAIGEITEARRALADQRRRLQRAHFRLSTEPGNATATTAAEQAATEAAALQNRIANLKSILLDDGARTPGGGADMVDPRLPLALLPVRLETRFSDDGCRLMIRIYPDDIHVDVHEPALTSREAKQHELYWFELETCRDRTEHLKLWRRLVAETGPRRALHIATAPDLKRLGLRADGLMTHPRAACLPDRFVAHVWLSPPDALRQTKPDAVFHANAPVREPLPIGPDLAADDSTPLGADAAWMHDFPAAIDAGMAIVADFGANAPAKIHRLVVTGLRSSVPANGQSLELADLLAAHERSVGLEIALPGDATNALPGERPVYRATPDTDALFEQHIAGRLGPYRRQPSRHDVRLGERTAAFRIGWALGMAPEAVGYTARGGTMADPAAQAVRRLLRLAIEPQLVAALSPGVAPELIAEALDCYDMDSPFVPWEPLPHLSIGVEPYGLLPVAMHDGNKDSGLDRLLTVLRQGEFAQALQTVPRVGTVSAGSARDDLISILRSAPGVTALRLRLGFCGDLAKYVASTLSQQLSEPLDRARQQASDVVAAAGGDPTTLSLLDWVMLDPSVVTELPLATPRRPGAPEAATYLSWLHEGLSPEALLNGDYPGGVQPDTVLFHIARDALLAALIDDILDRIVADSTAPLSYRQDARSAREKFAPGGAYWANMQDEIGSAMQAEPRGAGWGWVPDPDYLRARNVYTALGQLKANAAGSLDAALADGIDVLSYRLDAWFTQAAAQRLAELRNDGALAPFLPEGYAPGITLGAYGFVENLVRRQTPRSVGHVLAPSVQHAATAGVLLSADHADWVAHRGSDYAVDLTSDRVRDALVLLDAVASGQSLGAVLGYRIERAVANAGGSEMIMALRALAPTVANRLTPDTAKPETVAATTTLDGSALLRKATAQGALTPQVAALAPFVPAQPAILQRALSEAADAVDALSDLLLTESVFQLVRGSHARAQAAASLLAGAPAIPGEIEVARTPATGTAVTHRILLLLDAPTKRSGWGQSPRAAADPEANAWAAAHLPAPAAVLLVVVNDGGAQETNLEAIIEAAAQRSDTLTLGAIDVLLLADTPVPGPGLLLTHLEGLAGGKIDIGASSSPDTNRVGLDGLWAIAASLRSCLTSFRPVKPADLPVSAKPVSGAAEARIETAVAALKTLIFSLDSAGDDSERRTVLHAALLLGIGAGPGVDTVVEARAARTEAERRLSMPLADLASADRLKILLGPLQPSVIPMQISRDSATPPTARRLKTGSKEIETFLQRASHVRAKVGHLDNAMQMSAILAGPGTMRCIVLQTNSDPSDAWVGSEGAVPAGRTGVVMVSSATKPLASVELSAVFVDEWVEKIPAETANGALAFHYDAPSNAAPNVVLLCMPDRGMESWSDGQVAACVEEAISIAKMRAIDTDLLGGLGQFLPALLLRDRLTEGSSMHRLSQPETGSPL